MTPISQNLFVSFFLFRARGQMHPTKTGKDPRTSLHAWFAKLQHRAKHAEVIDVTSQLGPHSHFT